MSELLGQTGLMPPDEDELELLDELDELELLDELLLDDELLDDVDEEVLDEELEEEDELLLEDDELELLVEEPPLLPQVRIVPVELLPSPTNPKLWLAPGAMVAFQPTGVAPYGLLPVKLAFHKLVMDEPPFCCQPTDQVLIVVLVSLVMVICAVKPDPQSLVVV